MTKTAITQPEDTSFSFTQDKACLDITLTGALDQNTCPALLQALDQAALPTAMGTIRVNLQGVTFLDDFGVLVLLHIKTQCLSANGTLTFLGASARHKRFLDMVYEEKNAAIPSSMSCHPGILEHMGDKTMTMLLDTRAMLTFVGDLCLSMTTVLCNPSRLRRSDTVIHMQRVGVDALPIVALISFLLGLIMAFMSAVQLEQFGANIYVASLVSLSMVRELGPIMTAIIVAGRSGSAFAAEIGSMRVAEEVDALTTMGFDITIFLVLPRLLATLCVLPLLTLFSDLFAIAGGLVVGVGMLDLTTHGYMVQTINTISLDDIVWSMGKTLLFALLISGTGCFRGFQVRGGADAVGRATTSAVVTSIFLIILADSILAVIQRYWG